MNRAVSPSGDQQRATVTIAYRDGTDPTAMPVQRAQTFTGAAVPDANREICTPGSEDRNLVDNPEAEAQRSACVTFHALQYDTGLRIPDPHGLIRACCRNDRAVVDMT
jgi:hypothetical protein